MSEHYEDLSPLTSLELADVHRKVDPDYLNASAGLRLQIDPNDWLAMVAANEIIIPEGPWSITKHPNRVSANPNDLSPIYTIDNPAPKEQAELWRAQGLLVDTAGRPLHQRAMQVLTGPGMFTQPGAHYGYGPQVIANCGLRRVKPGNVVEYLTVWMDRGEADLRGSLPGGYVDNGETIEEAAARELLEETGVVLDLGGIALRQLVIPPHPYWKNTLHSWTEEVFVFVNTERAPHLAMPDSLDAQDSSEVRRAEWMSVDTINLHPHFLGAHRKQVLAFEALRQL